MKLVLITISALIIIGCSTQLSSDTNQTMTISFIKENTETTISSNEALLKTKYAIVKNWPFEEMICDDYSSKEKEFFTPLGPEKRVSVYDKENNLIAFAIESHSKNIHYNNFKFFHAEENIFKICSNIKCVNMNQGTETTLSNCNIILTNYEHIAARIGIADSGQQTFQVAAFCK